MKLIEISTALIILIGLLLCFSCSDNTDLNKNQSPDAEFSFIPENADTATIFTFDASASSDMEDVKSDLLFRWDFEGKSNWTESECNPITNYKYKMPGVYDVGMRVIDTEGWSDETRLTIIVSDSI